MADLERNPTLSDYYAYDDNGDDDNILDEENVNWAFLATRICAFLMLFLIILFLGLGAITDKFFILAAIMAVVLVLIIVGTYIDYRRCKLRRRRRHQSNASPSTTISNNLTNPVHASITASPSISKNFL